MTGQEHLPGRWIDISSAEEYSRLLRLARRRLVGKEHHAEDVVQRALMKWAAIPTHKRGVARIEQVIKSEAYSWLRSEKRATARDTAVHTDPSSPMAGDRFGTVDDERIVLMRAIVETCRRHGITVRRSDVEILELLMAGYSLSDIVRETGLSRHEVRSSRRMWKDVIGRMDLRFVPRPSPAVEGG
ncbi:MAG: hypothetical protein ACFCVK_09780 [Acidimicrobiales bacterium]